MHLNKTAAILALIVNISMVSNGQNRRDSILVAENKVWSTLVGPHINFEMFQELLAPDYFGIDSSGPLFSRQETIDQLKTCTINSYKIDSTRYKGLSNDTALIAYGIMLDASCAGQKVPSPLECVDVWIIQGGKWLMQSHTETPLVSALPN